MKRTDAGTNLGKLHLQLLSKIDTVALLGAIMFTPVSLLTILMVKYFVFPVIMSSSTVILKHVESFCFLPLPNNNG